MKIYLASDHAGFELKEHIRKYLKDNGYDISDEGVYNNERSNWAEYGAKGADAVSKDPENSRGIIICGSGIGMSMVSNKHKNVRAALCQDEYSAEMSRRHNNSNVLNMGARVIDKEKAVRITEVWLKTPFEGGRHQERLDYLTKEVEEKKFK
ncbi:MAG: ribose 5-phosphate isomerase B [Acidobacteriota bacterium]